ncbi:MutS-related protein [Butyrivibrio sp. MC2013]|uniref:MutS-related protein n=1 Tax=Butyrivibrio sp. MC2013 TaxID=1280686 RepID=UPI000416FF3A|nr:hypothetical protein [Butyrivibrio sp. MC2013]
MQVYLTIIGVVILLLIITAMLGRRNEINAEREFLARLKAQRGKEPSVPISEERFKSLGAYHEHHKGSYYIDDITWNDLSLDDLYKRVCYCHSGAGQEYLYHLLRSPSQTDDFEDFEEKIAVFSADPDFRDRASLLFKRIGSGKKYSVYDYLDKLEEAAVPGVAGSVIGLVLLILSVFGMFINFGLFFVLAIIILSYQIISYFAGKSKIAPYLSTFGYILRLLDGGERLVNYKDERLSLMGESIREDLDKMKGFRKGSFILMTFEGLTGGGDFISILINYFCMVTHADLIKFSLMFRDVRHNYDRIDHMITVMGRIESYISISYFRESLKQGYCIPVFDNGVLPAHSADHAADARDMIAVSFKGEGLYHPCLRDAVKNSIDTDKGVLITGSNASGKSTFLKTVAVAALMAQSLHTVTGDSYHAPVYRIYSSMALRDDMTGGDSYYMAEIKSLYRILSAAKTDGPRILCLVDEVLRGTNTVERIAASSVILKSLIHRNIQCFAATHDIELTELLVDIYDNYHFEGLFEGDDIRFTYKIGRGPATNRNAIRLLGEVGYDDDIVKAAALMAESFLTKGRWEMI